MSMAADSDQADFANLKGCIPQAKPKQKGKLNIWKKKLYCTVFQFDNSFHTESEKASKSALSPSVGICFNCEEGAAPKQQETQFKNHCSTGLSRVLPPLQDCQGIIN
ncbi:uncharacterized protein LOC144325525 [Podarcis muralis]